MKRMLRKIVKTGKKPLKRGTALLLVFSMFFQIGFPTSAFALTGGPSQPEVQSFEPISTSDMVDLFGGDFNYNIPLLNVDGYPINISYHSGITMDQEASWVGLGWNINPGVISRNVRGIPDDFDGEMIQRDFHMKDNNTYGVTVGGGGEIFGTEYLNIGINYSLGVHYNNYTGVGADLSLSTNISVGVPGACSLTAGLGITTSSDNGVSVQPSLGLSCESANADGSTTGLGLHVGCSFNSRQGLTALTIGANVTLPASAMSNALSSYESPQATFNLMQPTFTPQVTMPMSNTSITGKIKVGAAAYGLTGTMDVSGYYSSQTLSQTTIRNPAFGYMHASDGEFNPAAMMDFNREKDGTFTTSTPNLPVTNFTYDIFSASGQGMSGSYRPIRSDVGHMFDPYTVNTSFGLSLGGEIGVPALFHGGIDLSLSSVSSYSGDWSEDNWAIGNLSFRQTPVTDPLYESVYFKEANEKTVEPDTSFFSNMGSFDPQDVQLNQLADFYTIADTTYESGNTVVGTNYRQSRDIRNQSMSFLTRSQMDTFALDSPNSQLYTGAQGYHIGEITTVGTDGKRYVYGIAAYNIDKEEVTFATGENPSNVGPDPLDAQGYVEYHPGTDNSTGNTLGRDEYYSKVTTPPYAHSYLLTAVLSSDYVDADTIRGPSNGDLGTWTKFNYTKTASAYRWRVPVSPAGETVASYNQGLKSDLMDDKGNYVYGMKELWYLSSIETKNYIAVFYTSSRQDGLGVHDENGQVDATQTMNKLDSIGLYTKPNYNAYLVSHTGLVPVEVVHFVYNYSLCPGVPNTTGSSPQNGKLTLTQIYFTYQNSFKGALSPYKFTYGYGNSSYNPGYDIRGYDRWGFYKPFPAGGDFPALNPYLINSEYPYTDQNKANEDVNVAAWELTDITLPSGGTIHVDFESNDYAYVQDKPAMQMFLAEGNNASGPFNYTIGSAEPINPQIVFQFQKDASGNYDTVLNDYFSGIQNLYFRYLVEITNNNYEYVSGYAPIYSYGHTSNANYGYVQLLGADLNSNNTGPGYPNPIIKAAIQFGRLNTPQLVWKEPPVTDNPLISVLPALISAISQLGTLTSGPNQWIYNEPGCQNFVIDKSWIRLNSPLKKKLGGGPRVKDILMNDNWSGMTSNAESSFEYGQQYNYTLSDGVTSSGVASYEPQIGGDENPWRQPVYYDIAHLLIPDDQHYMEEPFGECFFPSASVGYSQVTVKNLVRKGVHRNATGYVVNEFYTTKDFPTITQQTSLQQIREQSDPLSILSLFNIDVKDYMTASQGYTVELNDMNGKPEAKYVYQESQTNPISSVQYYYQRDPYNDGWRLNNDVTVMDGSGGASIQQVGVIFDDVADFRNSETDNVGCATMLNVDGFFIFIPIIVPMVLPSFTSQTTRFRSNVVTKVIQRFGILDSTVVTDLGSKVKTENLAYDANSGEVLVTKTANDFNDPIYNVTYPAYWYYDGMGPAYENIGVSFSNVPFSASGVASIPEANAYFENGDELALTSGSTNVAKCWVTNVNGSGITAELKNGSPVNSGAGTYNIEVIRSGRRNQQSLDMAKLTSMVNPLNSLTSNAYQKVTQASAKVYGNEWTTYCNCFDKPNMETDNPYILGKVGNYRLQTSYLYLTTRGQSNFDNNTNIRQDGTYNSYTPFYSASGGRWKMTPKNWTYTSTVTIFNPYGQEVEDVDALGRYSSATFGYNQTLPTAVAANSKYQEMGFDGFEDYGFAGCADNHLDINRSAVRLDPTQSHTGRHSLVVDKKDTVKIGGSMTTCPTINPCNLSVCWNAFGLGGPVGDTAWDLSFQPSNGTPPYTYNYSITSGNNWVQSIYVDSYGNLNINFSNNSEASISGTVTVTDANGCTFTFTFTAFYNSEASDFEVTSSPFVNLCEDDR